MLYQKDNFNYQRLADYNPQESFIMHVLCKKCACKKQTGNI